jgi:hypothetical protein
MAATGNTHLHTLRDQNPEVVNLDDEIPRYRAVIEWRRLGNLPRAAVTRYLTAMVERIGMTLVEPPFTSYCGRGDFTGWGGWAHLSESGLHFMEYRKHGGRNLGSLDLYSCAPFDLAEAVDVTRQMLLPYRLVAYQVLPELSGP